MFCYLFLVNSIGVCAIDKEPIISYSSLVYPSEFTEMKLHLKSDEITRLRDNVFVARWMNWRKNEYYTISSKDNKMSMLEFMHEPELDGTINFKEIAKGYSNVINVDNSRSSYYVDKPKIFNNLSLILKEESREEKCGIEEENNLRYNPQYNAFTPENMKSITAINKRASENTVNEAIDYQLTQDKQPNEKVTDIMPANATDLGTLEATVLLPETKVNATTNLLSATLPTPETQTPIMESGNESILARLPKVYGVEDGGAYNKDVTITFKRGDCYIDGEKIAYGHTLKDEGTYKLELKDKTGISVLKYKFTIDKTKPVISGVTEGLGYNNDVRLKFNEGIASLNSVKIVNDFRVYKDGKYSLVVKDKAGNSTLVNFELDKTPPVINGIENDKEYYSPVSITFDEGVGKINGIGFESGKKIDTNGEYVVRVTDWAGNERTVKFNYRQLLPDEILKIIAKEPSKKENYATYKNAVDKYEKWKSVKLFANGQLVDFRLYENVEPILMKNQIMVPVKAVADYMGIRFYWDNEQKEYVAIEADKKVTIKINNNRAKINNGTNEFEIPANVYKGKPLIPLQFIADTFLKKIYWFPNDTKSSGIASIFRDEELPKLNITKKDIKNENNINKPEVIGVIDEGLYNRPVYIHIKSGTYSLDGTPTTEELAKHIFATLDGRSFIGGIVMDNDVHTLIVSSSENENTYVKFTIDTIPPIISGVEDGKTYDKPVIISFDEGSAIINGIPYSKGTSIDKNGMYELVVVDRAGNTSYVSFLIDLINTESKIVEKVFNKDIEIKPNEDVKAIYVDEKEVSEIVKLTKDGTYNLKIVYHDGSEKINKLILDKTEPTVTGIKNNQVYNTAVKIGFSEGEGTINTNFLMTGDVISAEGNYNVEVVDKIGNKSKISFRIDKTFPIITGVVDGEVYENTLKVYFDEGIGKCNNKAFISGAEFKDAGEYNIEVTDEAGNVSRVRFRIRDFTLEQILSQIKNNPEDLGLYAKVATKLEQKNYNGIQVFANGQLLNFEKYGNVKPLILDNRTFIPVRIISEIFGATLDWNNDTKTLYLKVQKEMIKMQVNSNSVDIGDTSFKIDSPVRLLNGRVIAPLRFINEIMGMDVYWLDYNTDLKIIAVY